MKGSAITGTVPIGPVLFNVVDPERFFFYLDPSLKGVTDPDPA